MTYLSRATQIATYDRVTSEVRDLIEDVRIHIECGAVERASHKYNDAAWKFLQASEELRAMLSERVDKLISQWETHMEAAHLSGATYELSQNGDFIQCCADGCRWAQEASK